MIKASFHKGACAAAERFGIREASLLDLILGVGTPMAAKAGLNVMAPRLMPTIEKSLEVPFQALKNVGSRAVQSFKAPAAERALVRGLSGAPAAARMQDPAALIAHMSQGSA